VEVFGEDERQNVLPRRGCRLFLEEGKDGVSDRAGDSYGRAGTDVDLRFGDRPADSLGKADRAVFDVAAAIELADEIGLYLILISTGDRTSVAEIGT
jgi:hypothetical protein